MLGALHQVRVHGERQEGIAQLVNRNTNADEPRQNECPLDMVIDLLR